MSELVVTVKQGDLRGIKTESVLGGSYISFKGIPYASPPVGDLRFKDPQPPQSWSGVRDAFKEGSKCAQFDLMTNVTSGDDDCLYLNVSTTSLTKSQPVMFWIHGGGFIHGDGSYDMYNPDYIMETDVVYVSINYRLGVLGFLHLDHEVVPGNMGLKDIVAALQWVKENIAQFGGNPDNVTIFGESAGGAAVHYLLLSPLAKGLFHKAISQSGVAVNPWASVSETVDMARRYVAAFGRDISDPNEIVEYLRTVPVHQLIEVQQNLLPPESMVNLVFPFGPGVDDKSVEPFMPKSVHELTAEVSDVPVIIGYCRHEGAVLVQNAIFAADLREKMYKRLDENFEILVPRYLATKAPSKLAEIAGEIRKFYFNDKPITIDLLDELSQCYGDVLFVVGIHDVVESLSEKKSPTYFYRFSYDSPNSIFKNLFQMQGEGPSHGEEIQYLFRASVIPGGNKIEPGSTEEMMRERLVRLWTNFAKTGNPTPSIDDLITVEWEPVTKTSKNYLEIDAQLSIGENLSQEMWETWNRVYALADDQ